VFCSTCGKTLSQGAKFCAECGAVTTEPGAAPAVAPVVPVPGVPARKPLSGLHGALIAIGLLAFAFALGSFAGTLGMGLVLLSMLVTSVWAAFDSSSLRLREYTTKLAAHPVVLAIEMLLLWIITFPWYLVVRSKIRAGQLDKRERPVRLGLAVLGAYVGFMMIVALGSAALFMSAGSSVKGIWQQSDSQLAAANTAVPSQTTAVADPAAVSFAGTYNMKRTATNIGGDNGQTQDQPMTGSLEIVQRPGGRIAFNLNAAFVVDAASGNVHTGELDGEAEVRNGEAVYAYDHGEYDKCSITMRFATDRIDVKQEQTCGFGTGVDANGTYVKISSEIPKLAKQ
jgi:hypothetical protein